MREEENDVNELALVTGDDKFILSERQACFDPCEYFTFTPETANGFHIMYVSNLHKINTHVLYCRSFIFKMHS